MRRYKWHESHNGVMRRTIVRLYYLKGESFSLAILL